MSINFQYLEQHGLVNEYIDIKVCYDRIAGDFVAVADYEDGEDRYDSSRHVELPYRCCYEAAAKSLLRSIKAGCCEHNDAVSIDFYEARDKVVPLVLKRWEHEHGVSVDWTRAALI